MPNISTSKGNQAMKFGQLIEYNIRNIFFEKSYTKCAGETINRPLSKNAKLSIFLDQYCKGLNSLFLLYGNLRAIEISENRLHTTCFYLIKSFFEKQKVVWNYFPCRIFCIVFKENYFSWDVLLTDQISLAGCL